MESVRQMKIIVMTIYLILSASGLILFKLGATGDAIISFNRGLVNIKVSLMSLAGLVCYVCSFIIYLAMISKYNLSYIVPVTTGIMQVIMLIAAVAIFKETITALHVIGVIVILAGVFLINL